MYSVFKFPALDFVQINIDGTKNKFIILNTLNGFVISIVHCALSAFHSKIEISTQHTV